MKKILIIDDDQLVSNIYRSKLVNEGFSVEVAADGAQGLELVSRFVPDLVVLDLTLPKLSGIEVLKGIRSQPEFKSLPVVVFSNTYLSNLVQEAWKAGATKCLSKSSATPKQMIDVIRGITSKVPGAGSGATEGNTTILRINSETTSPVQTADRAASDGAYQVDLLRSFNAIAPSTLLNCRNQLQAAVKSTEEAIRMKSLLELYRLTHSITANAGIAGLISLAQVSDAVEALLKELCDKPKNINVSTLRTIALSLDFLGVLVQESSAGNTATRMEILNKPNILVVDDEAISRRAVTYALEKAKLPCTSVENPDEALKLLSENRYDLIFLDVDMPRINGYELCSKLRAMESNKKTPVVFVTTLHGFDSRANSIMAGGNDLIAKPFLFMELAVKALIFILKARVQPGAAPITKLLSQPQQSPVEVSA